MKKAMALVLVLALCVAGMATTAMAAGKIDGINESVWGDPQELMNRNANVSDLTDASVKADDEIRIYLYANMFVDEDGVVLGKASEGLTRANVSGIRVTASRQQNSSLVKSLSVEYDSSRSTGYIKIKFADSYAGTSNKNWSALLQLRVNGTTYSETAFTVTAEMSNEEVTASAGTDYIQLDGNEYVVPSANLYGVTLDLGNGVTIRTDLMNDVKYYVSVTVTNNIRASNADIYRTYNLSQSNLSQAGSTVRFNFQDQYHVYNGEGKYLGTTKDALPLGTTYHLTTQYVAALEIQGAAASSGTTPSTGSGNKLRGF